MKYFTRGNLTDIFMSVLFKFSPYYMTTDDFINHDQDQDQSVTEADQATDDTETDVLTRLERLEKGNRTLSEQLKKVKGKQSDVVDDSEEDIDTSIESKIDAKLTRQTWYSENKHRIDDLSEDNRKIFEEEAKGLPLEKALRLAEYNEPYRVNTNAGKYPRSASVSRNADLNTEDPIDRNYREAFGVNPETVKANKRLLDELIGK